MLEHVHTILLDELHADALDERLYTPQRPLRDTGIPGRMLTHWRQQALFLRTAAPGEHLLLDDTDMAWFRLLQTLRRFGMSIPALRQLKAVLAPSVSLQDVVATPHGLEIMKGAFGPAAETYIQAAQYQPQDKAVFQLNYLRYYLHTHSQKGNQLVLCIRHDGTYMPFAAKQNAKLQALSGYSDWMDEPHIRVPVSVLIEAV